MYITDPNFMLTAKENNYIQHINNISYTQPGKRTTDSETTTHHTHSDGKELVTDNATTTFHTQKKPRHHFHNLCPASVDPANELEFFADCIRQEVKDVLARCHDRDVLVF